MDNIYWYKHKTTFTKASCKGLNLSIIFIMQKTFKKVNIIFIIKKAISIPEPKLFTKISLSILLVSHNIGKIIKCIPKLKIPLINIKFCGRTNLYVSINSKNCHYYRAK